MNFLKHIVLTVRKVRKFFIATQKLRVIVLMFAVFGCLNCAQFLSWIESMLDIQHAK